ncbi:MAG: hypothetical protein UZ08_BCD001002265 [Candidatus Parvibacillus calidus]|nr:MAG: hypothetical protein UZ08_BCD001002265 [Candidatus Parvibacillus calidus]
MFNILLIYNFMGISIVVEFYFTQTEFGSLKVQLHTKLTNF